MKAPLAPSSKELPEDRLGTADEQGRRIYLYPADVKGWFRTARNFFHAVLMIIFLVLPWIRINGRQALLFDIPQRRFAIFGLTFWAHDGPMVFFVVGGAALALLLVTSIWGRVWCGWACPQTVFVDWLFRRIESWCEGDSVVRRRRDASPMTWNKFLRRSLKWSGFLVASLIITHSFLAYFIGTGPLFEMVRSSPAESPAAFLFMTAGTLLVLFDFGWFREQFCLIACPYGRLQSVLMDEHSMVVAYDATRGEPRRGQAAESSPAGDCVNCYRCVQVCPTGIDIRRGVQMECIACTACIDACDDVMVKTKRPKGLIRYDSWLGILGKAPRVLRFRTVLYSLILIFFFSGLVVTVARRATLDSVVVRAVDIPYQVVGQEVVNHFKVDLRNQSFDDLRVRVAVGDPALQLVIATGNEVFVPAGKSIKLDFFLKFPKALIRSGHGQSTISISHRSVQGIVPAGEREAEVKLVGPFQ